MIIISTGVTANTSEGVGIFPEPLPISDYSGYTDTRGLKLDFRKYPAIHTHYS